MVLAVLFAAVFLLVQNTGTAVMSLSELTIYLYNLI